MSKNYVSTFEVEGGIKILMVADAKGEGVSGMLMSALVDKNPKCSLKITKLVTYLIISRKITFREVTY